MLSAIACCERRFGFMGYKTSGNKTYGNSGLIGYIGVAKNVSRKMVMFHGV